MQLLKDDTTNKQRLLSNVETADSTTNRP